MRTISEIVGKLLDQKVENSPMYNFMKIHPAVLHMFHAHGLSKLHRYSTLKKVILVLLIEHHTTKRDWGVEG